MRILWSLLFGLFLFHIGHTIIDSEGYLTLCENYVYRLYCQCNKFFGCGQIAVKEVFYGINTNKCGAVDPPCTMVESNATSYLQRACDGKTSCSVYGLSGTLGDSCGAVNQTSARIKSDCYNLTPALFEENAVLDGYWTAWSVWGPCSTSCGIGNQTKSRTCSNPYPRNGGNDCHGNAIETRTCSTNACQVPTICPVVTAKYSHGVTTSPTGSVSTTGYSDDISTIDDSTYVTGQTTGNSRCCLCDTPNKSRVMTQTELNNKLEVIRADLSIKRRMLSSHVRRKTSAKDDRVSSVATGIVAVLFLLASVFVIVGLDSKRLYTDLKCMFVTINKFLNIK